MKKKIIIISVGILLLITGYLLWNNRVISTIILEINPSLEIRLNKNNKVVRVVPLNDDAKEIVKGNSIGKDLEHTLDIIIGNMIEKGYVKDGNISILLYSEGNVDNDMIGNYIYEKSNEKEFHASIIHISNISEEDKALAKKYNISIARASYVNEMIKDNPNLDIEVLKDKSVNELRETKESGKYCDKDYALEGDFCVKEIRREKSIIGDVCPEGYFEFDGKCYEVTEGTTTDEYMCYREFTLTAENECIGTEKIDAIPNFKCDSGELIKRGSLPSPSLREIRDPNEYRCEDRTNAKYPTERCYQQEHAIINGKCAMGPKPLLPTSSGCADDDVNYNGGCYDLTPDEPYICPDGERYDTNTEPCPDTFKYTKANGNYTCSDGYTLNGSRCEREVTEPASLKKICPSGYTLLDSGHCINKNKTTDFIKGNVCNEPDSRLEGNICIINEVVPANR